MPADPLNESSRLLRQTDYISRERNMKASFSFIILDQIGKLLEDASCRELKTFHTFSSVMDETAGDAKMSLLIELWLLKEIT